MEKTVLRFALVFCCLGLLTASVPAGIQQPTIAMKAVKVNPTCVGGANDGAPCARVCDCDSLICGEDVAHGLIAPTSNVVASPGDTIVVEIFASEWSPTVDDPGTPGILETERLRAFQVAPDLTALTAGQPRSTGDRGNLAVLTGDRCCSSDNDCDDVPGAACSGGVCQSNPSRPRAAGAFIDRRFTLPGVDPRFNRLDYAFFAQSDLAVLDLSTASFVRFASSLTLPDDACTYLQPNPVNGCIRVAPRYLGTLVLVASLDACGTFTVPYSLDESQTNLINVDNTFIHPVTRGELTINLGPCDCRNIVASTPPNCAIDARQPSDPDGSNPQGWNSVTLTFDCDDTDNPDVTNTFNWEVTQNPDSIPFPPVVSSVAPSGSDVTVTFNRNISAQNWTCLRYLLGAAGANKVCLGILPSDADANMLGEAADVLGLIDCLVNPGLCGDHQCDTDRTGLCAPPDILREIDLLNGAGSFAMWLGTGIVDGGGPITCPSLPSAASFPAPAVSAAASRHEILRLRKEFRSRD